MLCKDLQLHGMIKGEVGRRGLVSEGHEQVEETVVGTWELMSDRRQEGRCLKDKTRAAEHELAPVRSLEPCQVVQCRES